MFGPWEQALSRSFDSFFNTSAPFIVLKENEFIIIISSWTIKLYIYSTTSSPTSKLEWCRSLRFQSNMA